MTVSSTIEAKASGRGASSTPADAVEAALGVAPQSEQAQQRLNTLAHWGYGTGWGLARAALDLLGLRGRWATVTHFAVVLGAEQALLPALGVAKPTPSYGVTATATDTLHHGVYAVSTGLAYDAFRRAAPGHNPTR